MGCTYECPNCGATTTVVSQSTALDLLCHCVDSGVKMEYSTNDGTRYVGHETNEQDYELR